MTHLVQEVEASERQACTVVGLSRSVYRREPQRPRQDQALRAELRRLRVRHPRYGVPRLTEVLCRAGWRANKKKVQRLCRDEGLLVPRLRRRRQRHGVSSAEPRRAEYVNHVWSWDFIQDQTADGRAVRILSMVDEYSRVCVALEPRRSFRARDAIRTLEQAMAEFGRPGYLRSDNGPEFIAQALQQHLATRQIGTHYITPGSPWENPFVESFHGKLRDECLNRELLGNLLEARVILGDFQQEYNTVRPHSALQYRTPMAYFTECLARRGQAASEPVPGGARPAVSPHGGPVLHPVGNP